MSIYLATRGKVGSAISIATAGKISGGRISEIITKIIKVFTTKNRILNFITKD